MYEVTLNVGENVFSFLFSFSLSRKKLRESRILVGNRSRDRKKRLSKKNSDILSIRKGLRGRINRKIKRTSSQGFLLIFIFYTLFIFTRKLCLPFYEKIARKLRALYFFTIYNFSSSLYFVIKRIKNFWVSITAKTNSCGVRVKTRDEKAIHKEDRGQKEKEKKMTELKRVCALNSKV